MSVASRNSETQNIAWTFQVHRKVDLPLSLPHFKSSLFQFLFLIVSIITTFFWHDGTSCRAVQEVLVLTNFEINRLSTALELFYLSLVSFKWSFAFPYQGSLVQSKNKCSAVELTPLFFSNLQCCCYFFCCWRKRKPHFPRSARKDFQWWQMRNTNSFFQVSLSLPVLKQD